MKFALVIGLLISTTVFADRVQFQIRPPAEPIELLPEGTTAQIARDWTGREPFTASQPDRSTKSIWIRMFPVVSPPEIDPYPATVDRNDIDLSNDGGLDAYSLATGRLLGSTNEIRFDFSKTTFKLGTDDTPLQPIWITPKTKTPSQLVWDQGRKSADGKNAEVGIRLRGGFVVEVTDFASQGLWSVTNVTDVESYIYSVVPSEAVATWHAAALQAQAIAARTYALYQMVQSRSKNRAFDLDPTTWYQSFRGIGFMDRDGIWETIELPSTTAATQATAGQVILYNDEVIPAYFSDNSGGITCRASECFNQPDVPYLPQVSDAPGVQKAVGGTWGSKADITPAAITKALKSDNIAVPSPVVKLQALKKGPSGRVWQLRVVLKKGHIDLDQAQTRTLMTLFGRIRSFLYQLGRVKSGKQAVTGHGFGHGVGMSQEGAELYAIKGWTARTILKHFFSNTTVGSLFALSDPHENF